MNPEEKKVKIAQSVEDNNYLKKWGVGNVSLEHLSQSKSRQEILEQHRKAYPKITEFVKAYLNSTNKSHGKTHCSR